MTRPKNDHAHQAHLRGEAAFSSLSREALEESRGSFEEALEHEPDYARAMTELAYVHVHIAADGFHSAEEAAESLQKAETYAKKAVELAPGDYSTQWGLAFYYINSGKDGDFARGLETFEKAKHLFDNHTDHIERKSGLLAEMGEALVFGGDTQRGCELICEAIYKVPDWYRWNYGFALYCAKDYKKAIEELDKMYRKPGDPNFLVDSLLSRAASLAQLGRKEEAQQDIQSFQANSQRRDHLKRDWTIADELKRTPFADTDAGRALRDHWIEGLRLAGLPER